MRTPSTIGRVTATTIPKTAPTGDDSEAAASSTAVAFLGAGLLATVKHNLDPVRQITLPTCHCLKTLADAIQLQIARKHRLESDPISLVTLVVRRHEGEFITLNVTYSVPAYRTFDSAGKLIATTPALPLIVDISMQYIGGRWRVADYTRAA